MELMVQRYLDEREVLGTLIYEPKRLKDLPGDFTERAFEIEEFRLLYRSFNNLIRRHGELTVDETIGHLPEQRRAIDDVTVGLIPLEKNFRSRSLALMIHRPPPAPLSAQPPAGTAALAGEQPGAKGNGDGPARFEFTLLDGMDICSMQIPPKAWLIEGLITEKSVTFLAGEEGCGKSLLSMNLALSVAVDAPIWLSYTVRKHGKVLYLNNELHLEDFARRLKAMCERLPAKGDISNLIVPVEVPPLEECWETLNRACEQHHPCLLVIDCLYFAHDKDENDSSKMKALMRQILSLRDKFGLAVLIVHHTKKGAKDSRMHNDQMRGSSVFGGMADTTIQIRRSGTQDGLRIIKPLKGRHIPDSARKCRVLSLNNESLWFRDEGETDEDNHIGPGVLTAKEKVDFDAVFGKDEVLSRKEIQARLKSSNYDERTIDRLIKKALMSTGYGRYSRPV